ncbi:CPCC family cysteine-rich protein [Pseudomonas sp. MRSN 12121]|uniref:CPCC family cysteine-rich protein n=1 Tax=Pseudomonas sp. MRSN 12121 TaxID=1611770 RepID=UPI0005C97E18|nr:CPCC family cysteine-rich protein [Pseudomonas sp. MRSN 12121]
METITATAALDLLSRHRLPRLDANARACHLLNWWGIDHDDLEFATLSPDLQQQILTQPEPPEDVLDPRYDELLLIALRAQYRGVSHLYLMRCLHEAGLGDYSVDPQIELLEVCPCCGFQTLSARGQYEICDLCHWEDDGSDTPNALSGPNHKSLDQAREQFARTMSDLPLDKWPRAAPITGRPKTGDPQDGSPTT